MEQEQMTEKLRLEDFFHDEKIREEFDDVKHIRALEGSGFLGTVDGKLPTEDMRKQINKILNSSVLAYLIKGRGEREVWDHIKTLTYPHVAKYRHLPHSKDDFPSGLIDDRMFSEIPYAFEAIDDLPIEDAAFQLMMIADGLPSHAEVCEKLDIPQFEFGRHFLDRNFEYSKNELSLRGVCGGVRFELPENPKQLLMLGIASKSDVSNYAWCPWNSRSGFPVLMFDDSSNDYLGYIECLEYGSSLCFDRFECDDDSVERDFGPHPALWNAIEAWLDDENVKILASLASFFL